MDGGFPVYILDDDSIFYTTKDCGHVEYWEDFVSLKVSSKYNVPLYLVKELPYCQRRGRVVLNNFYCGEDISKSLLSKIEKVLSMKLKLIFDDHEIRCPIETMRLRSHLF